MVDQEELVDIYKRLKKILKPYESHFVARLDLDSKYDLWSEKDVEIDGRKRKEIWFASIIIQGRYVGFYFMPVYVDSSLTDVFQPELLSLLKGKSCFHIKKLDDQLEKQIKDAVARGFQLYKKRGWV